MTETAERMKRELCELRLAGPVRLHVAFDRVQDSGVLTKVYAGHQGDAEFEVYQTVVLLQEKVG